MKQLRVAYLGIKGLPARGGAERVVEGIVTRMPKLGVTPVVYCDKRYTPPGTRIDGVDLVRLPTIPGKYTRQLSLDIMSAIHALFFSRYDLVHVHNNQAGSIVPLLRLKYKVVATSHGWRSASKWGTMAKFLMRCMDWPFMLFSSARTCVASTGAEYLSKKFHRETDYVPNGVSTDFTPDTVTAQSIYSQYGLKAGDYFLFAAGRIMHLKGSHLAVEAATKLGERCQLLVVGDDAREGDYFQTIRDSAGPNVYFHSAISQPGTLFGLMKDAKCFVFPSLMESMSMALLEAASVGVPIICSDIPENQAVMQDDAIYFKSESVDSLVEKMEWALTHKEEMSRLAEAAKTRILREHSWDTIAERYFETYARLSGQSN